MIKETIKVGTFIQVDRDQWSEYPQYCSGTYGIVVKIGNKYAKVDSFARKGLINVEFNHLHLADKNKLDEVETKILNWKLENHNLKGVSNES